MGYRPLSQREAEMKRVTDELRYDHQLRDIEDEIKREHDEKRRNRRMDEFRRMLAVQAKIIADIDSEDGKSAVERKEARRLAEETFLSQLEAFRKGTNG